MRFRQFTSFYSIIISFFKYSFNPDDVCYHTLDIVQIGVPFTVKSIYSYTDNISTSITNNITNSYVTDEFLKYHIEYQIREYFVPLEHIYSIPDDELKEDLVCVTYKLFGRTVVLLEYASKLHKVLKTLPNVVLALSKPNGWEIKRNPDHYKIALNCL